MKNNNCRFNRNHLPIRKKITHVRIYGLLDNPTVWEEQLIRIALNKIKGKDNNNIATKV